MAIGNSQYSLSLHLFTIVWNCQYIQCGLSLAHTHTYNIMARQKYNITMSRHWCYSKYWLHTRLCTQIKSWYQHKGICGRNVWDMPWHIHVYIVYTQKLSVCYPQAVQTQHTMGENQANPVLSTSFEAPATQFLVGNCGNLTVLLYLMPTTNTYEHQHRLTMQQDVKFETQTSNLYIFVPQPKRTKDIDLRNTIHNFSESQISMAQSLRAISFMPI